jgi:transposase
LGALADGVGYRGEALLAQYVRAYVRRNKTDAADATALLEAARASDIHAVRVKSIEQQALEGLHRIRSLWMGTCTSRINALRGFCREFGIAIPLGARTGIEVASRVLADPHTAVPDLIRATARLLVEEIRLLEARIAQVERELAQAARLSAACTTLLSVPGIGLLTATAMVAATSGDVSHFKDASHFASWFGLTPKEYSSGNTRFLGHISKRGDRYLRMLLTHGARSILRAAAAARTRGREVDGIRAWALDVQRRSNHNTATCALANKLARICYATLRDEERRSGSACLNSIPRFISGRLCAVCQRCRVVHGGGRRLRRTDRRGGQLGAHRDLHLTRPASIAAGCRSTSRRA